MIFNQISFLFLFLPLVLAAFFLPVLKPWRYFVLIAGSFVFYGLSGLTHASVLLIDILWVYFIVRTDAIVGNKTRLVIAVIPPFLGLFYYKYLGFFINQVLGLDTSGDEFSLFTSLILPAGISFFTFQLASFAIDRFRGEVPQMPPLKVVATYISFFPQLVAGPIVRFSEVATALKELCTFKLSQDAVARSIGYICIGLSMKVLIADTLGLYLEPYESNPGALSVIAAVYVVLAYSFQIYFDFYGYSLIAIGLGSLFGFQFPANFRRPYESLNPADFWRRWHMTLSFWIRDYLYLPLGGNERYLRNIFIVFMICGLWHGAGWNFIVWGIYHAVLVAGYHSIRGVWNRMPAVLQWSLNFSAVSLGWVLFIFDFERTRQFFTSLAGLSVANVDDPTLAMWTMSAIAAVVCFAPNTESLGENRLSSQRNTVCKNVAFAAMFILILMFMDRSSTFIYFRF